MNAANPLLNPGLGLSLLRGDEVTPEPVRWLWKGWLAKGKLHVLAGAPGTGKTTLAVNLAAVITKGGTWPDGTRSPVGDVLIWSAEDDVRDTLIPRFHAAGADVSRVWFIRHVDVDNGVRDFDPASDLLLLEERLRVMDSPALLIVDPIVNAIAGDSHKNGEVRRALAPMVALAERHSVAVLGITHFSKGTAGREPTERVTGSVAFGALARIVMVTAKGELTEDGEESDRLFMRSKSNIGHDDGGYKYALEQVPLVNYVDIAASVVRWRGVMEGSARDALAAAEVRGDEEGGGALREAVEFLRDSLAHGSVPVNDLQTAARAAGHSPSTLRRAKERLGVRPSKCGRAGGWVWALPEDAQLNGKMPTQNGMDTFRKHGHLRGADESEALE